MLQANAQRERIEAAAYELGFDAFGVCGIEPKLRRDYYLRWIADGKHGDMSWLSRNNDRRLNPRNILPEARSILALGMNYWQPAPPRGYRIAQYALGGDYHKLILGRLKQLCRMLREELGADNKPYVDTGPVLEKPVAQQAGLGWQGKNTMLLHRDFGTWLFLGFIFTTLELHPDAPGDDHCGSCTRCITACPTRAITAPYQLDATRCISYLTIEHKGCIPLEYRRAIGDYLYGCDDCLDVCPWNRWARETRVTKFQAREYPSLQVMLDWSQSDFDAALAGTAMRRIGLARWKRNVCIVLGNTGTPENLPTLKRAASSPEPLIAEHAQWAIDEIELRNRQSRAES